MAAARSGGRMTVPDLSAFGDVRLLAPLPGGRRNAVWLAETGGARVVAKSTRRTAAALAWLAPLHAAARRAGFVVPAPIRAADGAPCARGWTLEPFVPGRPATGLTALSPRLRAFHAALPALPQRPGMAGCLDLLATDRGGDTDLGLLPADLAALCRAAWATLRDRPARPIHGDIGAGNLIATAAGPALIDWDEARCDFGFLDYAGCTPLDAPEARAHLAWETAACWQIEPARARALAARLCRPA